VVWYIEKYGVDETIVWSLSITFTGEHPWHLRDALKEVFNGDPTLKDSFKSIAIERK